MFNRIIRFFTCSSLIVPIVGLAIGFAAAPRAIAQENAPQEGRPLSQSNSILSFQGAQQLMTEADAAIGSEQYDVAVNKLQQARKIFNQLSNFHLQLADSFSGIDTSVFESQRQSALQSGQLRDEATYQLALVHRAQNKPELAVPLLIQIIRSQNPTSELGKKSYQQLYELGFVETPFSPSSPTSPPQQEQQEQQEDN
ncbi:MAG: hypothetical protein MUD14_13440 [Hydrococcus sp. Prado102]|jgi:hypothetical protein|nr:hypothetical protein [Hydrococcus sp. Prado102]